MSFTVTTYTCKSSKYCTNHGDRNIPGTEGKLRGLCEEDPDCVGYYYTNYNPFRQPNNGRICYSLSTEYSIFYKMCTKGTK